MTALSQSLILHALAVGLLNSLWQFALLWLIFIGIVHFFKNTSPVFKYNLALLLLGFGTLLVFVNISLVYFFGAPSFITQNDATQEPNDLFTTITHLLNYVYPYLSIVYLSVITFLFMRFVYFLYATHLLQTKNIERISPVYKLYVKDMTQRMSIKKKVVVWLSKSIDTPILIGYFKPMILLPVTAITQLTHEQIEAILLHEIAHIKRNDYLVNVLINLTGILLFFNPFAKLFISVLQKERENSCDDWVLQFKFSPESYAAALLTLERSRLSAIPLLSLPAAGTNNKHLLHRVQRILDISVKEKTGKKQILVPVLLALIALSLLIKPAEKINRQDITQTPIAETIYPVNYTTPQKNENDKVQETISNDGKYNKEFDKNKSNRQINILSVKREITKVSTNTKSKTNTTSTNSDEYTEKPIQNNIIITTSFIAQMVVAPQKNDFVIPSTPNARESKKVSPASPYIPGSSFEYYSIQDSVNKQVVNERALKIALLKANAALQLALEKNISPDNNLLKNLQQSLTGINYFEIENVADIINMQATAIIEMLTTKPADKQKQIDSLQKEIKLVKKEAVISL